MRSRRYPGVPARGLVVLSGLVALALAAPRSLDAQAVPDHLYDTWQITASGALVLFDSSIRVDGENGSFGTEIDTESDLGLARTQFQPRGAVRWRPGRRHELEVGYQIARRDAARTIRRDIRFRDTVFTAGADVSSTADSDNLFLTYRLALSARESWQAGLGVGVGAIFQTVRLQALVGRADDGGVQGVDYESARETTAPTFSVGGYGRFRLGDRWYLEPDLRGIWVSIDRWDARILEAGAALRWFPWDRLGFEGGWSAQAIRVLMEPVENGGSVVDDVGGKFRYLNQNVRLGVVFAP